MFAMDLWRRIFRLFGWKFRGGRRVDKYTSRIYPRIKSVMEEKSPYLDPEFSIYDLARLVGTNRTYITETLKRYNSSFVALKREYRVNFLIGLLTGEPYKYDLKELAVLAGFGDERRMCDNLKKYHPDVYNLVRSLVKK
jgi:hypothetical protein